MKYLFCFLISAFLYDATIYSFIVNGIDRHQINFNDFQGKKILLVNVATGGSRVNQIGELQQLKEQYGDSLVIIGFPSNSFGHEPRSNSQIKQFCLSEYSANFLLAAKASVKGNDQQTIYYWLTHHSQNNFMNSEVREDFQKYLIGRNGELIGVFAGSISPLSQEIITRITSN